MLKQKTFYDKNHVAWLNRPGGPKGFPVWWILALSLILGQIIRLVDDRPFWVGLAMAVLFAIAFLLSASAAALPGA